MKSITLCIDDYGMSDEINDATNRLVGADRVHAVSCMSSMPGWSQASRALHHFDQQQLDVGLHLNLTEPPDANRFGNRLPVLISRAYSGLLPHRAIAVELNRQFDEFEQAFGRLPDFVDGHQHVHQLPGVRDIVLDIVCERYLDRRPWLRSTKPRKAASKFDQISLKQHVIYALGGRQFGRDATALDCQQNQGLIGVYDFQGSANAYHGRLAHWLSICQDGDLLMCHPARASESLPKTRGDKIMQARLREYSVLMSEEFPTLLRLANVQLRPLSQIATLTR